jgi:Zn finger protein HypA/HybF involved in hydrogenase expression
MEIVDDIELPEHSCVRCQHRWFPRKQAYPKRCPKCTSAYWDTPTKKEMLELDRVVDMNSSSHSSSPSKMLKGA